MAGISDPLTDLPPPSRFDPEDLNTSFLPPPVLNLPPPFLASFFAPPPHPKLLILCASRSSVRLFHHLPTKKPIASMVLPELSMSNNSLHPSLNDKSCFLYTFENPNSSSLVVAVMQYNVAPERANAWARALLQGINFDEVLVLADLQGEHYRGRLSCDEALFFRLESDAERVCTSQELNDLVPYLPSGSLVEGVTAALMSFCQMRGLKARAILSWPEYSSDVVNRLAKLLPIFLRDIPEAKDLDFRQAAKSAFVRKPALPSEIYV